MISGALPYCRVSLTALADDVGSTLAPAMRGAGPYMDDGRATAVMSSFATRVVVSGACAYCRDVRALGVDAASTSTSTTSSVVTEG